MCALVLLDRSAALAAAAQAGKHPLAAAAQCSVSLMGSEIRQWWRSLAAADLVDADKQVARAWRKHMQDDSSAAAAADAMALLKSGEHVILRVPLDLGAVCLHGKQGANVRQSGAHEFGPCHSELGHGRTRAGFSRA